MNTHSRSWFGTALQLKESTLNTSPLSGMTWSCKCFPYEYTSVLQEKHILNTHAHFDYCLSFCLLSFVIVFFVGGITSFDYTFWYCQTFLNILQYRSFVKWNYFYFQDGWASIEIINEQTIFNIMKLNLRFLCKTVRSLKFSFCLYLNSHFLIT